MKRAATTEKEKAELLKTRATRLQFFVETFGGRANRAIEIEAYLILETYQSRPRAIYRYARHATRHWLNGWRFTWTYSRRYWWYRFVEWMEPQAAHVRVCEILEEKFFAESKED
jgi:hypothetical protein